MNNTQVSGLVKYNQSVSEVQSVQRELDSEKAKRFPNITRVFQLEEKLEAKTKVMNFHKRYIKTPVQQEPKHESKSDKPSRIHSLDQL